MRRRTVLGTGAAALTASLLSRAGLAETSGREADILLGRLSAMRRMANLPDLAVRAELADMARLHACHMSRLGRTTHVDSGAHDPVARARQARYPGRVLGETLAETYEGPVGTADAWLAHEQTRAVLLDPRARDVGVCALRESTGLVWWDLVLGTRDMHGFHGPAGQSAS